MSHCPICNASLSGYDSPAAEHHVNQCLDSGSSSSKASSAPLGREGSTTATCPLCNRTVEDHSILALHVKQCLATDSNLGGGSSSTFETDGRDANVRAGGSKGECPSCLLEWDAMQVPYDLRELHVADCLAQREALAEDDDATSGIPRDRAGDISEEDDDEELEVLDQQGNALSKDQLRKLLAHTGLAQAGFGRLRDVVIGNNFGKGKRKADPNTANLIPLLGNTLERAFSSASGTTRTTAVLCSPVVIHVKSQFKDFGWGCGYRNAQMVISALRHHPQYRALFQPASSTTTREVTQASGSRQSSSTWTLPSKRLLPDESVEDMASVELPTILELQEITEAAWAAGFDPEGRQHFKGKLVNSRRWIGTSEVYVMLTWMGVRATIIDFPKAKSQSSSVGGASKTAGPNRTHHALTRWVFDYFDVQMKQTKNESNKAENAFEALMASKGSTVRIASSKMPLYLQHQGHSRTIVGVEVTRAGELNLLVFDPGRAVPQDLRQAAHAQTARTNREGAAILPDGPSDSKRSRSSSSSTSATAAGSPALTSIISLSDHSKLLSPFRVSLASLSRKDEYQIVRIETDGGPLTPDEKLQRRRIRSLEVV